MTQKQKLIFVFFFYCLHCVIEWMRGDTWPRSETEQLERQAGRQGSWGALCIDIWVHLMALALEFKVFKAVMPGSDCLKDLSSLPQTQISAIFNNVAAAVSAHRHVVVTGINGRSGQK